MRAILLSFIIGFCYSLDAQKIKSNFKHKIYQSSGGLSLPYRIAHNQVLDSRKQPLLVFLHGSGERGNDNEKQLTHGIEFLYKAVENHNAIVIVPQCQDDSYWSSVTVDRSSLPLKLNFDYPEKEITPDLAAVAELINELKKSHPIDRRRIYIMGLSMGGMGTFEMVHRFPKCFAAAIPICGGGDAINYTSKARKIPFWVMHGDADPVVDVNESRKMISTLKEKRYKVRYTEYPGVNHNSWENAFEEPDLLDWIFKQSR